MDEARHLLTRMVKTLWVPPVIAIMVPLALLAALGFYLVVLSEGFWQVCRGLPGWVFGLRYRHPKSKPHFARARVAQRLP